MYSPHSTSQPLSRRVSDRPTTRRPPAGSPPQKNKKGSRAKGKRLLKLGALAALLFAVAAGLVWPARKTGLAATTLRAVQTPAPECQNGLGGLVFAQGREVEVEILPGNPNASYTSSLFLSVSGKPPVNFGTSRQAGKITKLGTIPVGTELTFFIIVQQTGDTFFMGPADRNDDGVAHAVVSCLPEGKANVAFEDLRNGGDRSYNDLQFQVRFNNLCNPNERRRAVSEDITNLAPCDSHHVGPLSASYGRFGYRASLESDAGEKLEVRCDGVPGFVPSFHLWYTRPGQPERRVGTCPFIGGCNTAFFKHSGDLNDNGIPDCFVQTYWKSRDYDLNDNPNPWTGQHENTPVLDHAVSSYDVINDRLTKEDRRYTYRQTPPIECVANSRAEGRFLGTVRVDPPLGPITEAFFNQVDQALQQLGPTDVEMSYDTHSLADLNRDGQVDALDRQIFDASFGTCEGSPDYNPEAEFNADGCVNQADEEVFTDLFNAASHDTSGNHAPVAACKSIQVVAGDGCTAAVTAADVNDASSDPDGDPLTLSLDSNGTFGLGQHNVTLTVTDSHGASSSCTAVVTVVDRTAPAIVGEFADRTILSPPDHRMQDVYVFYTAADNCGAANTTLSVSSNEPADVQGDGHTSSDWEVVDAHRVRLRAERSGTGAGRVYTITITATDAAGNTSVKTVQVSVPHN